jgi:hypothetical protein
MTNFTNTTNLPLICPQISHSPQKFIYLLAACLLAGGVGGGLVGEAGGAGGEQQ